MEPTSTMIEGSDDVENHVSSGLTSDLSINYQSPPLTHNYSKPKDSTKQTLVLIYQSLGVVYGDLATSPVNTFSATRITNLTEEDLLGTLSLIIWALTFLVLIKYVFIVLNANDRGEGGTFALYSYIRRHVNFKSKFTIRKEYLESDFVVDEYDIGGGSSFGIKANKFLERSVSAQTFLIVIVLLGTCMVIGDGALTPATCVLSAMQGIQSRSSKITQDHVVWISVVILVSLFAFQRCGTSKVSFWFTPIMLLWFSTNVAIGVYNIIKYHPSVIKAISPHYIVKFVMRNGKTAWDLLGTVFLGITGAEAMFADLGHFNKRAIQLGFSFVVYPALVITYAGETAYLVKKPENITDAYYSSLPDAVYWPMFVVSILAAVVSSQSMISASFSIVKQSLALGCFPQVNIIHTSSKHEGQVYSPEINYILMILTIGLVVGFRGGVELTNAYGVVVIWVMLITTLLTALVMLIVWKTNLILVLGFFLPYMLIETMFMTSLLKKIPQGGWVSFLISAVFLTIMMSWAYGTNKKRAYEAERKVSIAELDEMLCSNSMHRTPGICFFYTDPVAVIPPILHHYIQQTKAAREVIVIVTTRTLPISSVGPEEMFHVRKLGNAGVYRCLVQFGYMDARDMNENDHIMSMVAKLELSSDVESERQKIQRAAAEEECVYVIGRSIMTANKEKGALARFTIDRVYRFLQKNSSKAATSTFKMPSKKIMQVVMLCDV